MAAPFLRPWPNGRPSEAQELLLRAALLDGERAVAAWRSWKEIDAVATTDHDSGRLLPLVCRNLLAIGLDDDPDMPTLKSAYRHQWVANSHRLARAGEALAVLSQAGIETMALKGAALVDRHYRDAGVRLMYDVDVLVRPEAARLAAAALERGGWRQYLAADLDDLVAVAQGTRFDDPSGVGLDLHWHALWSPGPDDELWAAAEPATVGGVGTLRACPADQLLHVCVHGIWSEGERVRWVPDAATVLRTSPDLDWGRLVRRARAGALTLPLADALCYLQGLLGPLVPADALSALRRSRTGPAERAGHVAWRIRAPRVRLALLTLERYRRQRRLAPAITRERSLAAYLRRWATVMWGAPASSATRRMSDTASEDLRPMERP